jgi:PTS system nitrogen regulatory IIA component
MPLPDHEILTLEEVALYLRVSERTVYDWANKGEIPCGKLGTTWRFKRSEIAQWVDRKLTVPRRTSPPGSVALREILTPERVLLLDCEGKEEALRALAEVLGQAPEVGNPEELTREVFAREQLMSTGIGRGVGVPHVRLASVKDLVMAVGVNARDLSDYASLDERPVRILCMLAARDDQHAQYLKTLAAVSNLLKDDGLREALVDATDPATVYALLTDPS